MKNLYNEDGTLCPEAQSLLSPKPDDMSMGDWIKAHKEFRSQLSSEENEEFKKLKNNHADKRWYLKNKERKKHYSSNWKKHNPEKATEHNIKYGAKRRAQKPEEIRKYIRAYYRTRRQNDPMFKLLCNIRTQASRVIKQLGLGKKPSNTFKWIGCSAEDLKAYLESLFCEGMNWDNYGEWHIDHIRPVSSFAPEEWEQINHYTNLQPLWAKDNILKKDKWDGKPTKNQI